MSRTIELNIYNSINGSLIINTSINITKNIIIYDDLIAKIKSLYPKIIFYQIIYENQVIKDKIDVEYDDQIDLSIVFSQKQKDDAFKRFKIRCNKILGKIDFERTINDSNMFNEIIKSEIKHKKIYMNNLTDLSNKLNTHLILNQPRYQNRQTDIDKRIKTSALNLDYHYTYESIISYDLIGNIVVTNYPKNSILKKLIALVDPVYHSVEAIIIKTWFEIIYE